MNPLKIASVIGIVLALVLLVFTFRAGRKIPAFMRIILAAAGVLIMVSAVMIFIGSSALSV